MTVDSSVRAACLLEATARKPGNVHLDPIRAGRGDVASVADLLHNAIRLRTLASGVPEPLLASVWEEHQAADPEPEVDETQLAPVFDDEEDDF